MLIEDGMEGQACRTLVSKDLLSNMDENRVKLLTKHPIGAALAFSDLRLSQVSPLFGQDAVKKALRTFPKNSAAGPSGWRAQHIFDAVMAAQSSSGLQALTDLINLLARGSAPRELAPHITGTTLMDLLKDNNDVRLIVIG